MASDSMVGVTQSEIGIGALEIILRKGKRFHVVGIWDQREI